MDVCGALVVRTEGRRVKEHLHERWSFLVDAEVLRSGAAAGDEVWVIGIREQAPEAFDAAQAQADARLGDGAVVWYQNVCVERRDAKNRVWVLSADKVSVCGSGVNRLTPECVREAMPPDGKGTLDEGVRGRLRRRILALFEDQ